MEEKELPWTGERLVTCVNSYGAFDHLHRYALAIQLVKEKTVLDIASGEGYGSNLLAFHSKAVIGVDISSEAVLHSSKKYVRDNLEFRQGSADNIPLPDNSIDVVVSFETIEHHDKHDEMLFEIKRVLRPNGILIISSPDKLNYSDLPKYSNPFHIKELYKEEFEFLVKRFFSYVVFFNQKSISGSLIVPELNQFSFKEFDGDYYKFRTHNDLQNPIYNLCIACDEQINFPFASFFRGKSNEEIEIAINALKNEIVSLKKQIVSLKNSRRNWISRALRKLKGLIKV